MFEQYRGKEKAPNQCKNGNIPLINEISTNNGLSKYATPTKVFTRNAITISINYATTVFYQSMDFCASVNISILKNDKILNKKRALFIISQLRKINQKYDYTQKISKDKINDTKIQLPITANGEIDFDFMESFIAELEAERVRELEAYLKASGLSDTTLNPDEKSALNTWNSRIWQEFKIGDLFEKLNLGFKKSKFEKDKDVSKIKNIEFQIPLVNAKDGDNGIMYYGKKQDFDTATMTIDIVNDGAVSTGNVYPQPQETGVLYNAYLIKSKFDISKNLLFFFATTIQKSIKLKFSY
ncbi:restriction endonuclease subunit S, partial [Campylobacter sp.]|uniref:restriction endonuclease subunit S n=1 Tax=Campylobacter sp. TaxID=205 RepID=UPI002AA847F4